jgi:hypothetical protein
VAAKKSEAGKPLTREQMRAAAAAERQERERITEIVLRELPKGAYCRLAGRQQKVIDEAASRYGLPLLGPTVNLFEAVKTFHDMVARYGQRMLEKRDEDLETEKLRAEIQVLKHRRRLMDAQLREKRNQWIPRRELREMMTWLAAQIHRFGERLKRDHGNGAADALNELLQTLAVAVENSKDAPTSKSTQQPPKPPTKPARSSQKTAAPAQSKTVKSRNESAATPNS